MNYEVLLNGKVVDEGLAYAPLEEQYKGTHAIIRNKTTFVEWYADPDVSYFGDDDEDSSERS